MGELDGKTILIVVASEINQFVWGLQEEIERTGAKTTVAFGTPDTSDVAAAIVNVEQQAVVSSMHVPVVVYYDGDTPEQIVTRLRRVLGVTPPAVDAAEKVDVTPGFWSTWRGIGTILLVAFVASIVIGAGVRLLKHGFGWG